MTAALVFAQVSDTGHGHAHTRLAIIEDRRALIECVDCGKRWERPAWAAKEHARELGRLGGLVSSAAKSRASRANGLKGGRPKKSKGSR